MILLCLVSFNVDPKSILNHEMRIYFENLEAGVYIHPKTWKDAPPPAWKTSPLVLWFFYTSSVSTWKTYPLELSTCKPPPPCLDVKLKTGKKLVSCPHKVYIQIYFGGSQKYFWSYLLRAYIRKELLFFFIILTYKLSNSLINVKVVPFLLGIKISKQFIEAK